MSADLLRRAAAKMRERAEAATAGPWAPAWAGGVNSPDRHIASAHNASDENAAHIASWHPAVALAVADWLDSVAAWDLADAQMTRHFVGPCADTAKAALAVARAYLEEES